MPYTPTAPTITLCDDLVTFLAAACDPYSPSSVRRAYLHRIDLKATEGRHVIFFPTGYDNRPATRGHDFYTHRITVLTFERYVDAADAAVTVPQEWVDERVDFVHTQIVNGLDFYRDGVRPSFGRNVVTLSADVPEIYDAEKLNQQKEFWCAVEMVFEEQITA